MNYLVKIIFCALLVSQITCLVRKKRFWGELSGGFKNVGNAFNDAGNVIGKGVNDLGGNIVDTAQDTGDAFQEGAEQTGNAFEDLGGYIKEGAEQTGNAFEDLGGYIKEGAEQTGDAFEDGFEVIKDGFDDLSDEVKAIVKEVVDSLKEPTEEVKNFFEKEVYEEAKKAVEKLSDVNFDQLLEVVLHVLSQLDKLASYRVCTGVCKFSMGLVIPKVAGMVVCPLVCDVILHSVYGLLDTNEREAPVSDNVFVDECQVPRTCNECNKACDVSLMKGPLYNVTFTKYSQTKSQQQQQQQEQGNVAGGVVEDGAQPHKQQSLQLDSNGAMNHHLPGLTVLCCAVALTLMARVAHLA